MKNLRLVSILLSSIMIFTGCSSEVNDPGMEVTEICKVNDPGMELTEIDEVNTPGVEFTEICEGYRVMHRGSDHYIVKDRYILREAYSYEKEVKEFKGWGETITIDEKDITDIIKGCKLISEENIEIDEHSNKCNIKHYVLDIDGEEVNAFSVSYKNMYGVKSDSPPRTVDGKIRVGYESFKVEVVCKYKVFIDDK